jgi:hypothetical protein
MCGRIYRQGDGYETLYHFTRQRRDWTAQESPRQNGCSMQTPVGVADEYAVVEVIYELLPKLQVAAPLSP